MRTFAFCFLSVSLYFWWGFAYVFRVFSCKFAPEVPKNSLHVRSCFLSRSLCLRVWVDDVFIVLLFSPLSLKRDSSGLTGHHTPPRTCCLFFFFRPRRFVLFACSGRASFCSGVSSGCHSGPRAFFGFSRDSSEAFLLGREAVEAFALFFLWSVVFPVLRLHTFLVGLAPDYRMAGPRVTRRVGSPAPPARMRVGGRLPFLGGGTQTPSCLASFCF